jgi:hypothetical protein
MCPHLTGNELTMYFSRMRDRDSGAGHIFVTHRSSVDAGFDPPVPVGEVNSSGDDGDPMISADGQTLVFTSNRAGGQGLFDVWIATRSGPSFVSPTPLTSVSSPDVDSYPFLATSGDLWLARTGLTDAGGFGAFAIYEAAATDAGFAAPVPVADLADSTASVIVPVLSADGLTVYFGSTRVDGARGGLDIWSATRNSTSDQWTKLKNVRELNTGANEVPGWLSPDDCRLYYDSTEDAGTEHRWMAERAK